MNAQIKNFVLMALMVSTALVAPMLRATEQLADQRPPINLETMIPQQIGEWRNMPNTAQQLVNPEQQATIDRIYAATLSRTYINPQGYRIMLSVAYGKNQSESLALHKPEVCYPAQGFKLVSNQRFELDLPGRTIPASRLVTQFGQQRHEPVTYWTMVGDIPTHGGSHKKLTEIRYNLLQGVVPDGVLMRVSSIDRDTANAHRIQADFSRELVAAIAPENRARFAGVVGSLISQP